MMSDTRLVAVAAATGAIAAILVSVAMMATDFGRGFTEGTVRNYLLSHPKLLAEMSERLQAQQEAEENLKRQNVMARLGTKAFFDPKVAFVTGPANAKISVAEFFDYNCVHCRNSLPAMKKFYDSHKNARFAFIDFPIFGADSDLAARAAVAAREQPDKYVEFHFALMGSDGPADARSIFATAEKVGLDMEKLRADMKKPEIEQKIAAARTLAAAAEIDGTPTFVINGQIHAGEVDDALLDRLTRG